MDERTFGEKVADTVAQTVGSWRFIIIQSFLLICWIILNVIGLVEHWDAYPFILLNLMLSFQAAYTGPIVMMSQNRAAKIADEQNRLFQEEILSDEKLDQKNEELIQALLQRIDVEHLSPMAKDIEEIKKYVKSAKKT